MRIFLMVLAACGGSHVETKQPVLAGRPSTASSQEASAAPPSSAPTTASDCATAIRAIKLFDRAIDPDWQETFRLRALDHLCTRQEWSADVRACLRDASNETSAGACILMLDSHQMARVAEVVSRAKTIERLQATPAVITCDRVAEHVHSDASTRRRMSDACTKEQWSAPVRACVIADGHGYECPEAVAWSPWLLARKLPTECHELERARQTARSCRALARHDRQELDDWWSNLTSELRGEELGSFAGDLPALCDAYGFRARKKLDAASCSLDPKANTRQVTSNVPPDCAEYRRVAQAAKSCRKLPQKMRDEVGVMPDWLELDGDEQVAMPSLCALLVERTRTAMTAVGC